MLAEARPDGFALDHPFAPLRDTFAAPGHSEAADGRSAFTGVVSWPRGETFPLFPPWRLAIFPMEGRRERLQLRLIPTQPMLSAKGHTKRTASKLLIKLKIKLVDFVAQDDNYDYDYE